MKFSNRFLMFNGLNFIDDGNFTIIQPIIDDLEPNILIFKDRKHCEKLFDLSIEFITYFEIYDVIYNYRESKFRIKKHNLEYAKDEDGEELEHTDGTYDFREFKGKKILSKGYYN